jgi:Protein of unknown function (DUF1566)
MTRWFRLGMVVLIMLALWGFGLSSSLKAQVVDAKSQPRFTRAANGVITDHLTGLDWYVRPNADNNWHEAKAWVDGLTVAGGGWRLPTVPELKGIYQKGASRVNMDPLFEPKSAWVWSGQMDDARTYYGFAFYSGLVNSHGLNYGFGRMAFAVRSHK